jgi:hypothetical protein
MSEFCTLIEMCQYVIICINTLERLILAKTRLDDRQKIFNGHKVLFLFYMKNNYTFKKFHFKS